MGEGRTTPRASPKGIGSPFERRRCCAIVRGMLAVGLFAVVLFLLLVLGDWMHFTSLSASASQYGCGVTRLEERLKLPSLAVISGRFDQEGLLNLPHGVARWFQEDKRILLRPQYRMFSLRFRTAWPIKGTIDLHEDGDLACLTCVNRIPWSSAIMTLLWFAVVGLGTVGFLVAYAVQGGMTSLGSLLTGLAVTAVGVLVFFFGLITVSLAYRLENERLTQAYKELREALLGAAEALPEHISRST